MTTALDTLDQLEAEAPEALRSCSDLGELEDFRVEYLGRNGRISELLSTMPSVPADKRPEIGKRANQLKQTLEKQYEEKKSRLEEEAAERERREEWMDVTLPGRHPRPGSPHPITVALSEQEAIFERMGFEVLHGPEIETEWYNFEALNIPEDHPARDMHDTFYLNDGRLLRTHTSPVQIHAMESRQPPLRMVAPGRVYRRDADMTHSPMFHQIEGLWVDSSVTFADLKGTLQLFLERYFGQELEIRFRPGYFPFTEPSAEVDMAFDPGGTGDREWLEVLGAGMVDPAVFDAVEYDSGEVQGFAFGMGVERLAMLKYGIDNIQRFFENDLRFLGQF